MAASAGSELPGVEPPDAEPTRPAPSVPASGDQTEDNAFLPITIGTVAWLIAGVVLLVLRDQLAPGSRWWIGSCAVGVISGVGGMIYVKRRAGRPRRAAARRMRASGQE